VDDIPAAAFLQALDEDVLVLAGGGIVRVCLSLDLVDIGLESME